jgi:WD40 repeat protein
MVNWRDSNANDLCRTVELIEVNGSYQQTLNQKELSEDTIWHRLVNGGDCFEFSSDSKCLFLTTIANDGLLSWDLEREGFDELWPCRSSNYVRGFAVSPNGKLVAIVNNLDLEIWSVEKQQRLAKPCTVDPGAFDLAFSSGTVALRTPKQFAVYDISSKRLHLDELFGQLEGMDTITFSPDGEWVEAHNEGALSITRIARSAHGKNTARFGDEIHAVTFSPDSRAVYYSSPEGIRRTNVCLSLQSLSSVGHHASCLAVSPDGRLLAAGNYSGNIIFLETGTGNLARQFKIKGYFRIPWFVPAALLILWLLTAILLYRRRKKRRIAMTTGMMSSTASLKTPLAQPSIPSERNRPH